jgi:hypothetical protein
VGVENTSLWKNVVLCNLEPEFLINSRVEKTFGLDKIWANLLFGILGRGLRRALIRCTLGSGKSEKGLGFWRGGHKGTMGNKGEQFTDNLGPRWTIPVTSGGAK